eukprot:jgi/Bigna1/131466/aug1.14_g6174
MRLRPSVIHPTKLIRALSSRRWRFLGLDVGDRTVGLALSDDGNMMSSPLTTIYRKVERPEYEIRQHGNPIGANRRPLQNRHDREVSKELEVDGKSTPQAVKTTRFVEKLQKNSTISKVPWYWHNEVYSTSFARDALIEKGIKSLSKQKKVIDAMAASRILQSFLTQYGNENVNELD